MTRENLDEDAARLRRREQLVVLILAAVQFTTIVDFMIVMPLGPQLMRTLHIGPAQFGLIVSSYTFAAGAAGLVASSVVDRFARRTTFLVLYSGFLLGTLFCASRRATTCWSPRVSPRGRSVESWAEWRWLLSEMFFPNSDAAGPPDRS